MEVSPLTDSSLPPVAYDDQNLLFSVFSEDYDFDGTRTLTVNAFLTNYAMHTH